MFNLANPVPKSLATSRCLTERSKDSFIFVGEDKRHFSVVQRGWGFMVMRPILALWYTMIATLVHCDWGSVVHCDCGSVVPCDCGTVEHCDFGSVV